MSTKTSAEEGWTWIVGTPKWHYIREGMSLCNKWMMFQKPTEGFETGNHDSKDNCKMCARIIKKEEAED